MMIYYDYSTAWYVHVMDWWHEEMCDKIVESGVESNTNFAISVHRAPNKYNKVHIRFLHVIEQHFYNLKRGCKFL